MKQLIVHNGDVHDADCPKCHTRLRFGADGVIECPGCGWRRR